MSKKKIKIPLMIQDARASNRKAMPLTENVMPRPREIYLDGPVSKQVAVLDFNPDTGKLDSELVFNDGTQLNRIVGWYQDQDGVDLKDYESEGKGDVYSPAFMQVSVFATVLITMDMLEGADTLGRELTWAFDSPQLFVIPRAGRGRNAYYDRASGSLQFYYDDTDQGTLYTCLSRDIVAHETGHAIIDGIAPDLLDACTPESTALHEALADITALLMAFRSDKLTRILLRQTRGSIAGRNAFNDIAEEFGMKVRDAASLRSLLNRETMETVDHLEPHDLSQVISGAIYNTVVKWHELFRVEGAKKYGNWADPEYSASGRALAAAAKRLRRMAFRALDYLPPGDATFRDFGRAMIAVDQLAYGHDDLQRDWITDEFIKRKIVPDKEALDVELKFDHPAVKEANLRNLLEYDWHAYQFANNNRELLNIPDTQDGAPTVFEVLPRRRVVKEHAYETVTELIFKVRWQHKEPNASGGRYGAHRYVTVGTTLAIDCESKQVLARLTSAPPAEGDMSDAAGLRREEYEAQRQNRDAYLSHLSAEGYLQFGTSAIDPDGETLPGVVRADVEDDILRIYSTGNMLHLHTPDKE